MISFWAAPGVLVTIPTEQARWVFDVAEQTDSIVFWHRRDGIDWQPFLMPRPRTTSGQ